MSQEISKVIAAPVVFNFFDNEQFATMQRICTMLASSELVPDMYKITEKNPKEKAIANCMIAVETAQRIGASPLMVMQNLVIIYGRPSWSSKFLVATVNTCGRFEQLKYTVKSEGKVGKIETTESYWEGGQKKTRKVTFDGSNLDNQVCIAYAKEKSTGEVLESSPVSIKMAIEEGWYTKNGSKWVTMPKKMLMYRAASFWTNEHAPELSMGMRTVEENEDIQDIEFEDVSDRVQKAKAAHANTKPLSMDEDPTPATDGASVDPVSEKSKPNQSDWA